MKRILGLDWLWTLIVLLFVAAAYFGLSPLSKWLSTFKLFAPHPAFPPDMSPQGAANIKQGILFGMILKGNWWIVIAYFIGWVLNILGEEFWYKRLDVTQTRSCNRQICLDIERCCIYISTLDAALEFSGDTSGSIVYVICVTA